MHTELTCPRIRAHCFTLLELLVVIAVIGVLSALLLPALSVARDKAKSISCMNALRQIALATMSYTESHDEYLPPVKQAPGWFYWNEAMDRVVGVSKPDLWRCPSDTFARADTSSPPRTYSANAFPSNYGDYEAPFGSFTAYQITHDVTTVSRKMSENPEPTEVIMLGERPGVWDMAANRYRDTSGTIANGFYSSMNFQPCRLHRGAGNYLFADGHGRYVKADAIPDAWTPESPWTWQRRN